MQPRSHDDFDLILGGIIGVFLLAIVVLAYLQLRHMNRTVDEMLKRPDVEKKLNFNYGLALPK